MRTRTLLNLIFDLDRPVRTLITASCSSPSSLPLSELLEIFPPSFSALVEAPFCVQTPSAQLFKEIENFGSASTPRTPLLLHHGRLEYYILSNIPAFYVLKNKPCHCKGCRRRLSLFPGLRAASVEVRRALEHNHLTSSKRQLST